MPVDGAFQAMIESEFKDLPDEFRKKLPKADKVFGTAPTPLCATGTKGRIGVFEMLPTSKELEKVILSHPIEEEIYKVARAGGMFTMKEDAIIKTLQGTIPFEEINTLGGELLEDPEAKTA